MEFTLQKINYIQTGIINKGCAKLIDNSSDSSHLSQKIVIGDFNGLIQVFGMKKFQSKIIFKQELGSRIMQLMLGGSGGQIKEKIYLAIDTNILAFTKKGKQFLRFSTNLSEKIENMYVEDVNLFVTSKYIYQRYVNLEDRDYLLCPDQINAIICLPLSKNKEVIPILACRDRVLRILKNSEIKYELEVGGPPNVLCLNANDGGLNGNEIVYGTIDGKIGLIIIDEYMGMCHSDKPFHKWEISPENEAGSVSCINFYDITGDGLSEMLIGREDGQVEIYHINDYEEPFLIYETNLNQTITSIHGGKFGNANYSEVICTTYSGWVIGLTTEPSVKSIDNQGNIADDPDFIIKLEEIKKEISELTAKLALRQKEINNSIPSKISTANMFNMNEKFTLSPQEAAYILSIECPVSIDNVLIQSDTAIDLLDTEKNSAVVSFSHVDHQDGNCLLATYRCQANTTRLGVKIRSIEGQYGNIRVYITPKSSVKTCQMLVFPVKPLSLHKRSHTIDNTRPFNTLTLRGKFSLAEMYSWIIFCLPETPERIVSTGPENVINICYESTFLFTQLECICQKEEVVFRSDNLSVISILKDVLTKEATKKGISLDISYDINDTSIEYILRLIHPKIDSLLLLAKKVQLIEPLKELKTNENADAETFLSKDYCDILENADDLKEQFKKQPCHLERLYGIITDLYIDKYKFQGKDVRSNVKNLIQVLDTYKLENLIEFFNAEVEC